MIDTVLPIGVETSETQSDINQPPPFPGASAPGVEDTHLRHRAHVVLTTGHGADHLKRRGYQR